MSAAAIEYDKRAAGRLMETRLGYETGGGSSGASDGDEANITPFPQRTWTQVDNSYYDCVLGKVSMICPAIGERAEHNGVH